jgi:hypothetical protein
VILDNPGGIDPKKTKIWLLSSLDSWATSFALVLGRDVGWALSDETIGWTLQSVYLLDGLCNCF